MAKAQKDFVCVYKNCPAEGKGFAGQESTHNRAARGQNAHLACFENNGSRFSAELIDSSRIAAPAPVNGSSNGLLDAINAIIDQRLAGYEAGIDEEKVRELIERHAVRSIEITRPDMTRINVGRQHKQFEILLRMVSAVMPKPDGDHVRLNVWLAGPAGTGKTTAAEKCAEANSLAFASTGSLTESYKLFGFMSPGTGEYVSTPFRQIWENGGVFIFDDFDGSDPITALELNNALANGYCSFPDKVVKRHADCVLILTANTWGLGGTDAYVGRLKQDAAFLDRFVRLSWDIDEDLERDTCPNPEWVKRVQQVRARVREKGIRVLVTPRASYYGAALFAAGLNQEQVEHATIRAAMTAEQWAQVQ